MNKTNTVGTTEIKACVSNLNREAMTKRNIYIL
jgi:hypothetical protein